MQELNLSLEDAVEWLISRSQDIEAQFFDTISQIRAISTDPVLCDYIDHVANVRTGQWCWSFECERYFGKRAEEYATTRLMPVIMRKKELTNPLSADQVDVLIMEDELKKL